MTDGCCPGEAADRVLADISERPELADIQLDARVGTGEYTSYTGHTFVTEKFFPAWLADDADPFVTSALAAVHGAGIDAGLNAYRFCNECGVYRGQGGHPDDRVWAGDGGGRACHQ